jgi:hypothetical protein
MRELSRAAMPIAESPRSRAASQRCGASVSAGFTAERGVVPLHSGDGERLKEAVIGGSHFRFLSHRASLCRGRKNPRNLPHSEGIQLARVAVVLRRPLAEEQGNLVVPHVLDPRSRLQGSRAHLAARKAYLAALEGAGTVQAAQASEQRKRRISRQRCHDPCGSLNCCLGRPPDL